MKIVKITDMKRVSQCFSEFQKLCVVGVTCKICGLEIVGFRGGYPNNDYPGNPALRKAFLKSSLSALFLIGHFAMLLMFHLGF